VALAAPWQTHPVIVYPDLLPSELLNADPQKAMTAITIENNRILRIHAPWFAK
jgi:hypothetical protein